MFAYCNDNPVMFVDPYGTESNFIEAYSEEMLNDIINNGGIYNAIDRLKLKKSVAEGTPIDITKKLHYAMIDNAEFLKNYLDENGYLDSVELFINYVKPGGKWDFKSRNSWDLDKGFTYLYNGVEFRYDDIGNIHYGFVGRVLFTPGILLSAGGAVQIYTGTSKWEYFTSNFDDPQDQQSIELGCIFWEEYCER